jgi:type VI secretion system secreted protein VgrG
MDIGIGTSRFSFTSSALPGDTFAVVRFQGYEALSEPYEFDISLVSEKKDIDIDHVLSASAAFTIKRPKGDLPFGGILKSFEQHNEFDGLYFYRAVLVPRLWRLTCSGRQAIFLDEGIVSILTKVLMRSGMGSADFEFRLTQPPPSREYVSQYGETDFAFVSRWLEHYGMYFYFEQTPGGEKLVITDTKLAHTPMDGASGAEYVQPSALEGGTEREAIYDFRMRRTLTPNAVTLRDYNYRIPSVDLTARATLTPHGSGGSYRFGEHYRTTSEGQTLVRLRAEEMACRMYRAHGQGFAPFLRPGHTFSLENHPRSSFRKKYLTISVRHFGHQSRYGTAGLGLTLTPGEAESRYRNEFTALPADVQYRPPLATPRPVMAGSANAVIDAPGSGTYAELDDQGRYKVKTMFDLDARADGKASAFVRMAQPYGGAGFGMHFPLHKGTEVVLTFTGGNPDRPLVGGTAPNPDAPSQVKDETQTSCRLTTAGGNAMHIEDKTGSQRLLFKTGPGHFLRIGAHNDPPPPDDNRSATAKAIDQAIENFVQDFCSPDGVFHYSPDNHWIDVTCRHKWATVVGERFRSTLGWETQFRLAHREEFSLGIHWVFLLQKIECKTLKETFSFFSNKISAVKNKVFGQYAELAATETDTAADALETAGQHSSAAAEETTLAAQRTETAGNRAALAATEAEITQNRTRLAGEATSICQEQTALALSKQQAAGSAVTLAQSSVRSAASETCQAAQKTSVCQMRTRSAANIVRTCINRTETGASHTTL